jgi:hypothetical protein
MAIQQQKLPDKSLARCEMMVESRNRKLCVVNINRRAGRRRKGGF